MGSKQSPGQQERSAEEVASTAESKVTFAKLFHRFLVDK